VYAVSATDVHSVFLYCDGGRSTTRASGRRVGANPDSRVSSNSDSRLGLGQQARPARCPVPCHFILAAIRTTSRCSRRRRDSFCHAAGVHAALQRILACGAPYALRSVSCSLRCYEDHLRICVAHQPKRASATCSFLGAEIPKIRKMARTSNGSSVRGKRLQRCLRSVWGKGASVGDGPCWSDGNRERHARC